ncbi:MAG: UDP-N-acetylenolpyruvoylglucosamine reductase [Robiginitomaculum sp.]|nr:MAG: UDP-N-acetylenolpyruvoylglucosamine reductase [Robiginitomaculum sp.]
MSFPSILDQLPEVRGSLRENVALAPYTWFRVGGEAQIFFMPKDEADLALFLAQLPQDIPVQILGVASNTLVRDGGIEGVVIRLGPAFAKCEVLEDGRVRVGAACLDGVLAKKAAKAGLGGLEFYAGIPGTIGGALRMNAGCYGAETKDVLVEVVALDRRGRRQVMRLADMGYSYRHSIAASDLIFVEAVYQCTLEDTDIVMARMAEITRNREQSQPIKEKTGGSTFKNPDPKQSGGRGAWQVIDAAGGRGFKVGGAQMSEKHCNFMINTGNATAHDIETLGNTIRAMVKDTQGVDLQWEIKRIGVKVVS